MSVYFNKLHVAQTWVQILQWGPRWPVGKGKPTVRKQPNLEAFVWKSKREEPTVIEPPLGSLQWGSLQWGAYSGGAYSEGAYSRGA